jgi:hypothetical protein
VNLLGVEHPNVFAFVIFGDEALFRCSGRFSSLAPFDLIDIVKIYFEVQSSSNSSQKTR